MAGVAAGGLQFAQQGVDMIVGALYAHDAGKLPGESVHAAFEPISAVAGNGFGEGIHEAGAIAAEYRHDEVGAHGGDQSTVTA
jgi:hypothetical protein